MAKSDYVAADDGKLDEILRQAESRLQAQLALGIAADQRAMTFAGILAAVATALVAYAAEKGFSAALFGLIVPLLLGAGCAAWAASPIMWDVYGTSPTDWIDDIADGRDDAHSAKAAQASFYGEMITDNDVRMAANATSIRLALWAAILAPVIGGALILIG